MVKIPVRFYLDDLKVKGIILQKSEWREIQSGYQDEYTTEEIVCIKNDLPHFIKIRWLQKFFPTPSMSHTIIEEREISQQEYDQFLQRAGTVLDTPEVIDKINKYKELSRLQFELTPSCPKCGSRMTQRSGPHGDFWGRTRYPKCKGTKAWDEALAMRIQEVYEEINLYDRI